MNVISVVAQFLFVNTVKKIIMQMDMKHVNVIRSTTDGEVESAYRMQI